MPALFSPTILLVEDNLADVELLKARLSTTSVANQFTLDTANTLESGLQHLGQRTYDLVLLDLMLPDSGGLQTFERIFQRQPNTPIVVFTGLEQASLGRKLIALGAQDFIEKDKVSANGLDQQLQFAMGRRKATDFIKESIQADSIYWLADTIAQEFHQILADLMQNLHAIEAPLKDAPEALVNARKASEQALSGTDIVHLLLTLARPPSASSRLSIGKLIDEIVPSLHQQFGDLVTIELSEQECDWDSVFDDTQVRTMLLNTIGNVVQQFTAPTRLRLDCKNESRGQSLELDAGPTGVTKDFAWIRINAVGTIKQDSARATSDFSMLPGQKLIQTFIKKFGGSFSVNTSATYGTTVDMLLPRSRPRRRITDQQGYLQRLDVRSINVIVVGSDCLADGVIANQVSTLGYSMQVQSDLADALRMVAKGRRVDLIVVSARTLEKPGAIDQLATIIGYSFESKLLVICNDGGLDESIKINLPLPATTLVAPLSLAEIDEGLRTAHFAELDS